MQICPQCRKPFERLATHLAKNRHCKEQLLEARRRQRLQSTPSLSQQQQPQQTQRQQQQTPQQQTGNVGERNDSTVLLAGITKCPRCQKSLKRPLAHFNRNEECRSHFTQVCREQAQQSREQQNNELLQSWVDISPPVGSGHSSEDDDDDDESPKLGFATVTAQNSDGLTVSRRTSTRSVASRRSNKKRRRIGGSPRRAARPSYDADDESEDSSSKQLLHQHAVFATFASSWCFSQPLLQ